jgi:predicted short-subunit dehydrogenase-like oxidoreductase (DUF2520 family)
VVPEETAPLNLWVIGPGRVGLALASALDQAGALGALTLVGPRGSRPPDHPLLRARSAPVTFRSDLALPRPSPDGVLITVPDAAIVDVAESLLSSVIPPGLPILHTSGALGSEVLGRLSQAGCAVGSIHPLLAIADPVRGADLLENAWFAIEGDTAAVRLARRIVDALGGSVLPVDAGAKPLYHAAAVFASNYVVALLATAERMAADAGAPPELARAALVGLARSAVDAVARVGPSDALTGPISRGDTRTVRMHRSRLSGHDLALYSVLARATLEVARAQGLRPAVADDLASSLVEAP